MTSNPGPNTLFNTTARVANLVARWNATGGGNAIYAPLFTTWNSNTLGPANTGQGHALKFLATGNVTEALNSYNASIAETFSYETTSSLMYSDSAPFTYAWCKAALTPTQITNILARIESNNASRETNIGTAGRFLLDGPGNGNVGMPGYIYGNIAANGQPGITDRRTNLRNLVQNMAQYLDETYADGWWHSYDYIHAFLVQCIIAYHVATGAEALLPTRCTWFANRGEVLCRMLSSDGTHYFRGPTHDGYINAAGVIFNSNPEEGYTAAIESGVTRDPLMRYIQQQQNLHSTPSIWTHNQTSTDATWAALLFSDDTITPQSPTAAGTVLCKDFPVTGVTELRGGWNQATDLCAQFMYGPTAANDHNVAKTSSILIRVGNTLLIKDGHAYAGRGPNGIWETNTPINAGDVGQHSMCKSGISFSSSASQATHEDRLGGCVTTLPTGSATAYPLSGSLTNTVRQTWLGGSSTSFTDNGVVATIVADIGGSFPQITSGNTTFGYIRGATTDVGTFVIWDQFVAPGTIDHIRRNFWSFAKPTISGQTVLQGTATAGVLSATGDHVVITNGSYQATIQMVTTMSLINCIGGSGYESFFDGYPTNGANLDFLSNVGGSNTTQYNTEWPYLQNQWRTSFLTTQATAGGEMVFVITVGAAGSTAPTYTRSSALALLTLASNTMPGMTQAMGQLLLNVAFNKGTFTTTTFYLAAFTTVGVDNGTGFVEPSGNGYARIATTQANWNSATLGSPCSVTNVGTLNFPANTGSNWGTIQGLGIYTASSGGTLLWSDYLGANLWQPFTCTLASPGVITCDNHGFSDGDSVVVTSKYGGTLPTTGSSWSGLLTVASATTNTFTAGVNTTSVGNGLVRKVATQAINVGNTLSLPPSQINWTLA